jgi:hypothetical protein
MVSESNRGRVPVIHIGLPKTATKTMQWRLFSQHSEIYYLGRYDGAYFKGKYRRYNCCRDAETQVLMNQIAYRKMFSPDFPKCKSVYRRIENRARESNLLPVWSWESYSTDKISNRRVRARNLKKVFGEARIMITIRNPLSLLESAYYFQLRRDNVGANGGFGRSPYYRSMDEWLYETFNGAVLEHLEYPETIQMYVKQFGVENMHVFVFEDLVSDHDRFFVKLCDVMGIDANEGLELVRGEVDNSRWTTRQIEILEQTTQAARRSLSFKFARKKGRKKILELDNASVPIESGEKARAQISREWQKRVIDVTREGNLWLQKVFDLSLEEKGYFAPRPDSQE